MNKEQLQTNIVPNTVRVVSLYAFVHVCYAE